MQSIKHPPQARILCVDNHASRNLVVYLLEQAKYEVVIANSFIAALRLAQSEAFDLFLLNHRLAHGGAAPLYLELSERVPQTPILFYTSITYPYRRQQTIRCGVSGKRLRPIEASEVVKTISYYINHQTWPAGVVCDETAQLKSRGFSAGSKILAGLGIGAALILIVTSVQGRRAHGAALQPSL